MVPQSATAGTRRGEMAVPGLAANLTMPACSAEAGGLDDLRHQGAGKLGLLLHEAYIRELAQRFGDQTRRHVGAPPAPP